MNDLLGLALFAVPLVLGAMVPRRYALFAGLVGAVVAAVSWAWHGGISIHGDIPTLLFLLATPFAVGALTRAGIDQFSIWWRRACLLLGMVLVVWALWLAPSPANEPPMGPTSLLIFLAALTGWGIVVNVCRVEVSSWRRNASASSIHP